MENSLTLSFEDAGISFAGRSVLRGISFQLAGGIVASVRGANGSGKSTLLRLAAGLLRPTKGRVALRTAAENLDFFLGLRGIALSDAARRTLLARVGLKGAQDWRMQTASFSTGMRQRLMLAVLLGADAPFWLLDEPGANLDEEGRTLLASLAREAAAEGRLVLWATNEQKEEVAADARICIAGGAAHLS